MIFKFRMLSDEVEDFARDYEVPYDMNMADFRTFIRESVGYSPAEMVSIFLSDAEWEKLEEFTSVDMGTDGVDIDPDDDIRPPTFMGNILLGQVIREKFDRLIYVYDIFNERQFFIELIEAKQSESGVQYPRIAFIEGEPPLQFPEDSEDDIFGEAMEEFGNFEGDDNYDDE